MLHDTVGWTSPRRLGVLVLLLAAGAAGCYSSSGRQPEERLPVYPVRGQVFVNGLPAEGAFVVFHPEYDPADPDHPRPRAKVRPDGSFALWTYETDDGAPAGTYVVTVVWAPGEFENDRLGGLYADPARPRLTTVVLKRPNDLPPFRLE
jgi:hypothetical protein